MSMVPTKSKQSRFYGHDWLNLKGVCCIERALWKPHSNSFINSSSGLSEVFLGKVVLKICSNRRTPMAKYDFNKVPFHFKDVLKICSKFTGEHPRQNMISIKLPCTLKQHFGIGVLL